MATKKGLQKQTINDSQDAGTLRKTYRHIRKLIITKKAANPKQHEFINRSKGSNRLCIVLAGYKEQLWGDVSARLKAYLPQDVDVCVMTSGLKSQAIMDTCECNSWSYLSTKINQLSYIQNLAIDLHPNAQWILKIDEDMFVTEGFFDSLFITYNEVAANTFYVPAFVSPIINVNCYTFLTLLRKTGLVEDFCNQGFGEVKYTSGLTHHCHILESPAVARYLWGETQPELANIDALQKRFLAEEPSFEICPYRFSIGCILFTRDTWLDMNKFPVFQEIGLGDDEERIGGHAFGSGRVIVVDGNCIVGHLGYGAQTKGMLKFYEEHRDFFALKG